MIKIGLFGINGHQLPIALPAGVRAQVVAVAGYPSAYLDEQLGRDHPLRHLLREYGSLHELLTDPEIDLISLCSPQRSEQASHVLSCLEAGKHVLAEKPAAFSNVELDAILDTAFRTGLSYHEMADSMLEAPVVGIRRMVEHGDLGTIVHVQAHKSYPWFDGRPQNHEKDGGLVRQVGIHAMRFIIAATGLKITALSAATTGLGNPGQGNIHIAAVFAATLENGAIASINLNYLNPRNFGPWGNDQLRVYGTRGMIESVDGFQRNRCYLEGQQVAELPLPNPPVSTNYLAHFVNNLLDGTPMPTLFEEEIAAQRAVIAAYAAACTGRPVQVR